MNPADEAGPAIPGEVADYLGEQKTLTLATASSDGVPHATTLVYVNDGGVLYVWAHSSSATAGLIEQNPVVGFAVDEYSEDWRETRGVQGSGDAQPVTDGEELAKVGDRLGRKYPELRPGASGAVSFYRITPRELTFIDNSAGGEAPAPDEFRRSSVLEAPGGSG
jgi:nitroimidazol reductase NimA-like FMN-containing flavoprotein (pyridoxamine 5'-phosphate oxidase superfamily)